jgi:hypothetical protein
VRLDCPGVDRIGQQYLKPPRPSAPRLRKQGSGENDGLEVVQHLGLIERGGDDFVLNEEGLVDDDAGPALATPGPGDMDRAAAEGQKAPVLAGARRRACRSGARSGQRRG